ncbi:MAG: condensation domain-containing protein [Myxococcota bacterium]
MNRPVRGLEHTMVALGDAMGPDLIVGRVVGRIPPEVLRQAALDVVARHPALRSRRVGDRWVTLDPDQARIPFHVRGNEGAAGDRRAAWERVVESELRWPLDLEAGQPLRVVQVPEPGGCAIVLACHHAVVDGTSLYRVLHEVLVAVAARLDGRSPELPALEPCPAALDRVPAPAPVRWFAPVLRRLWASDVLAHQRDPAVPPDGAGPIHSIVAFRRGTRAGLRRLTAATHLRRVTVGQLGLAATAFALATYRAEVRGDGVGPRSRASIPLDLEVDLRRHARPPIADEGVGLYTSGLRVHAAIDGGSTLWDVAQDLGRQVNRAMRWGLHTATHAVMDGADPRELLDRAGCDPTAPGTPVNVSNVGRYPFPVDHGPVVLRDVYGLNGAVPRGAPLLIWLRGLPDGLCYNAVGMAPYVSRATLEHLLDQVVSRCENPPEAGLTWADTARAPALTPRSRGSHG